MNHFNKKVALVVGGGSGIGKAAALLFSKKGASVGIVDINSAAARKTEEEIIEAGGKAKSFPADVTDPTQAKRVIDELILQFGRLDFICNSAGIQTYGTVESTDIEVWDRTFDVSVKSIFLISKYGIPEIRKQGGGAIVHISSVQGIRSQRNVSAYAASKGAVIALTRSMAMDYAKENIRVNCICPGAIDTPLLRYGAAEHGPLQQILSEWGAKHPIGRIGQAEEMAATVLFLCSPDASFIQGQAIVADGGLSISLL